MDRISPFSLPPLTALPPSPATEPPILAIGSSGPTTPADFPDLYTSDYPDAADDYHCSINELFGGNMPSPYRLAYASAVYDAACYSWWQTDRDDISWPDGTSLLTSSNSGWAPTIDHIIGCSSCSFGGETNETQVITTQKPNFDSNDQSSSSSESPYDQTLTNHGFFTITERNPKRVLESYDGFPAAVGKPADDGYNWRKYGQKQVKGCEYPRGYYKCTFVNCTVKKNVERSKDGHITEIIYMGHHGHEVPRPWIKPHEDDNGKSVLGGDEDPQQETSDRLHGTSDSEESEVYQMSEEDGDDDHTARKRKGGVRMSEGVISRAAVKKSKVIVETRSEVDLLDDGYRWRKYGQKVVKGNPNPRSYYKCTTKGCGVRKHVERCAGEPGAVLTAYVGRHDHDAPVNRGQCGTLHETDFGGEDRKPMALKRLKEEQVLG